MHAVLAIGSWSPAPQSEAAAAEGAVALRDSLDRFLRGVERRALVIAELTTRDREEALDLVQEAMLRFVRRYALRPSTEWPPLFHRVLHNALVDWSRRQRVRAAWLALLGRRGEPLTGGVGLPAAEPSPEGSAVGAELAAHLARALAELPLRQRQVFLLRVWEGLDVAATARALGIGEGSIKTHLARALARLRERLHEHA